MKTMSFVNTCTMHDLSTTTEEKGHKIVNRCYIKADNNTKTLKHFVPFPFHIKVRLGCNHKIKIRCQNQHFHQIQMTLKQKIFFYFCLKFKTFYITITQYNPQTS